MTGQSRQPDGIDALEAEVEKLRAANEKLGHEMNKQASRHAAKWNRLAGNYQHERDETARLRAILTSIGEWDMLNPPQIDVNSDLMWLKGMIAAGLRSTSAPLATDGKTEP